MCRKYHFLVGQSGKKPRALAKSARGIKFLLFCFYCGVTVLFFRSSTNSRETVDAPVYSVIALSRQAFCSYTFFIFSQRKDGENVAECYKTIEYPDRKAIAALYAAGAKAGQIAKEIGVAPRTIYAELKRGREGDKLDKNFRPSYDADLAQKRAQESLRRRGRRKGGPAE